MQADTCFHPAADATLQAVQAQEQGNRLKALREKHKLRLVEVASLVDKDQSAVWRYENGRGQIPDEVKRKLATHYGVTVEYLMGWDTEAAA